jgi:hypothetical protein
VTVPRLGGFDALAKFVQYQTLTMWRPRQSDVRNKLGVIFAGGFSSAIGVFAAPGDADALRL